MIKRDKKQHLIKQHQPAALCNGMQRCARYRASDYYEQ